MNRDLFGFAILLVLLGIGFGIYLISFFGLLLMIPAFLIRSRPKTGRTSLPVKQQVRRITPPRPPVRLVEPPVSTPQPVVSTNAPVPPATTTPTYAVPLFPTSMFPSLSMTPAEQTSKEATAAKPTQGDEVLEIGAILALLRFAFG
ncbi:MAG: hypothetical protein OK452_07980 [Thaumarchaeota archaeon]|nr:hypothetical protein [Nitrososphaerota archaeon]